MIKNSSLTSAAIANLIDYFRKASCTGVTKYDLKEVYYKGVKCKVIIEVQNVQSSSV